MPVRELLDAYNEYVFNDIPTYLIRTNDMKLVTREVVRSAIQPQLEKLTEADIIAQRTAIGCDPWKNWREDLIPVIQAHLKYAILSHRWLNTGEPLFDDVSHWKWWLRNWGQGYNKLLVFCQKAREYGCEYAWSDTCCINKSSSSELEEAIRSMYRWYSRAEVCITYLGASSALEDFPSEPWFTRGWTLQELLAPPKMKFFGKNWKPILPRAPLESNDKDHEELLDAIHQVTMIPKHQIVAYHPRCTTVWEKMLWASRRRTTRKEDMAYCLIGILDITMPIAYGEGDWAFHRLMEVIIQRSDELEIFAWTGPPSPYSLSFPRSPACYKVLDYQVADQLELVKSQSVQVYPEWVRGIGDESFITTKHGLEIELVMIDLRMVTPFRLEDGGEMEKMYGEKEVTLSFKTSPLAADEGVTVLTDIAQFYLHPRWALGIVNYGRTVKEEGRLCAGKNYLCFLLGCWPDLPVERWAKFRTNNLLIFSCKRDVVLPLKKVCLQHSN